MPDTNEGLTHSNILYSDEEAFQPDVVRAVTCWQEIVSKYGLSPCDQDAFLCFLRAHGYPTAQADPETMDTLYAQWINYKGEMQEGTRKPGQLPWDALVENLSMNPIERDEFLSFIEAEGFKKTTRLPVLEAVHFRFRRKD